MGTGQHADTAGAGLASDPQSLAAPVLAAMLGVAGILAQEIAQPDVFWYTSGATVKSPIPILGLLAVEVRPTHQATLLPSYVFQLSLQQQTTTEECAGQALRGAQTGIHRSSVGAAIMLCAVLGHALRGDQEMAGLEEPWLR